ncbi:AraC family transcriptional regulator [Clostridium sp. B9]|uniref:AraC family transcriptional regulator n=1 Tax=Clostridium sp. B9 TaxID=3423224 RepID=UPI003D2F278E
MRLFFNRANVSTSHHWHEDIEIIYLLEGNLKAGVNNKLYNLRTRDILMIGPGEVHYFSKEKEPSTRAVIQFRMSIYDSFHSGAKDRIALKPMFSNCRVLSPGDETYDLLEAQIKDMIREYEERKDGYKLFLKARLYDVAGLLIRHLPKIEENEEVSEKQKERLEKLDNVMQYVEKHYNSNITLDDISKVAGFSKYHFTRFFKGNTGMTFIDYLNNFRIAQSEWILLNEENNITDIAFKSGFNSVKSFNRVFKDLKGCSPMEYKKKNKI